MATTAPQAAINYATRYVGVKESPPNSNRGPQIDAWQRAVNMLGAPWCGAFAFACLKVAGVKELTDRMRYVPWIVEDARKGVNGMKGLVAWADKRPGDLVIYQWDAASSPVDHVGLLYATVNGTTLRAIEGNTAVGNDSNGGEVMVRTRNRANVAYIVRPNYPSSAPNVPLTPCEWPGITLRKGTKAPAVKVIQGWINTLVKEYKYTHLDVDGDYGPATEAQVKLYQSRHRLEPDGVVGALTWRAMCASVRSVT